MNRKADYIWHNTTNNTHFLETLRKDILVKGRFNTWDAKDWAFLSLAIVLPGLGLFFLSSPDLREIAIYPLLGCIPFVVVVLIRILFLGRFHITRSAVVWKMLIGPLRTASFDTIGFSGFELKNEMPVWLLTNKQGKKIRRFKECKPATAAGAAILYFRYMNELPELVFNLWTPLTKGKRTYENVQRVIRHHGRLVREDVGFIVLYENRLMFIPTIIKQENAAADQVLLEGAGLCNDSLVYHPDPNILTHTLVEAILEANLPLAIRDDYMQRIISENGGCLITEPLRTGKVWEWAHINGLHMRIERP